MSDKVFLFYTKLKIEDNISYQREYLEKDVLDIIDDSFTPNEHKKYLTIFIKYDEHDGNVVEDIKIYNVEIQENNPKIVFTKEAIEIDYKIESRDHAYFQKYFSNDKLCVVKHLTELGEVGEAIKNKLWEQINPTDIYEAFNLFKIRFLKDKKSIFTDKEVLTRENMKAIRKCFLDNPIEGNNQSFNAKIQQQLKDVSPETRELFAHMIWLWSMASKDMLKESKKKDVNQFLEDSDADKENNKFLSFDGIMNTGQYHKTNKFDEIKYIIDFCDKILASGEDSNFVEILKSVATRQKKIAMRNILLHFFDPNKYEPIVSFSHKEKIISFFESQFNDIDYSGSDDLDDKLFVIQEKLSKCDKAKYENFKKKDGKVDFYHKEIENLWKNDIVLESKNIILHGAPGTGKTFSVENTIKKRLEFLEDQDANKQFVLVQFHPSYAYEDFMDGIKPAGIYNNGNIKFELTNGMFKDICIEACKELKNNPKNPKKYYFVADEINRAELSRVFGELLLCIEEDKRLKWNTDTNKWEGTKVKTQNSKLWKEKHAVIKEGNESYFGVPENLYFIGTMNDIDRSVDSFDMALRRRFYWKYCECDYDVLYEKFSNDKKVDTYIKACQLLNKHISSENGFNLGASYELGHAYFLKIDKINKTQILKLWENHIAPLLKEYLRSDYSESEIEGKLDEAKKKFVISQ
jgi:MoxR-like ATPase